MNSTQQKRIRHGELHSKAWNPKISKSAYAAMKLDGEDVELRPLKLTQEFADEIKVLSAGVQQVRMYALGDLRVVVTIDITDQGRLLHVSCVSQTEFPSWPIMLGLRKIFFPPDVAAVMLMPDQEPYAPLGYYALHLWQLPAGQAHK